MRRTEPPIRMNILESLALNEPLKITHIQSKANINFKKLENFLDNLITDGLVKEKVIDQDNIVYLIATRGLRAFRESPLHLHF
jgi:predicted transcriptional regulator